MTMAAALLIGSLLPLGQQRDIAVLATDGTPQAGEKWALLIGCNGYDANEVGPLKVAVADAKRLRETLVSVAGFEPGKVQLLTDDGLVTGSGTRGDLRPGYTTMRGQIAKFTEAHKASDVLLLFFAGHGFHAEASKRDYLAPLDVQRADLEGTAVPVEWVLHKLKESGARQSVLIVDACRNVVGRSGQSAGVSEESLKAASAMGVWYLASCRQGQISQEDPNLGGGVYTTYLAEGLAGPADGAGVGRQDGYVTVLEAQAYAASKTEEWSRARGAQVQTPCRSEFDVTGGEMVLSIISGTPPEPPEVLVTTAILSVTGSPAGAKVFVDGQERGTLPCEITIDLGANAERQVEVTVAAAGHQSKAARVTLRRGQRSPWEAKLEQLTAPPVAPPPTPPGGTSVGSGTSAGQVRTVRLPGGATMDLVWVPGGSFMMGSNDGYVDEQPVHRVELDGFWIGRTEVTVGQWRSVMGAIPEGNDYGDDHPVVYVSWEEAQSFCQKAGLQLPTEAQWEYAARGPQSLVYPWGNQWDSSKCQNWGSLQGQERTAPVGSYPSGASWCGALDMAGNVWEWCRDWYDDF